jgi:hypothetical protein
VRISANKTKAPEESVGWYRLAEEPADRSKVLDFLKSYFSTLRIPMNLPPEFPADAAGILLTGSEKNDPDIVAKSTTSRRSANPLSRLLSDE